MMITKVKSEEGVLPYAKWNDQLESWRQEYAKAKPFPHIVRDNFLQPLALEQAINEFPSLNSEGWIHYVHINERKFGKTDRSAFGPSLGAVVDELNSDLFVSFLSKLSNIKGLFSDPSLEGGGLHQSGRGGYLNIHADFTIHPHHRNWRRRINVLIYLNKDWNEEYGGYLEFWDKDMKRCTHKIAPIFNRCVIFNTDLDTFHGHPEPTNCPPKMTRKSIALYYFTRDCALPVAQATNYRARPGDGIKSLWIYFDAMVLRFYDIIKRCLGIDDKLASDILKFFSSYGRNKRVNKNILTK